MVKADARVKLGKEPEWPEPWANGGGGDGAAGGDNVHIGITTPTLSAISSGVGRWARAGPTVRWH